LFDMGGVLVELGSLDELLGLDGISAEEFWPKWLASPTVRALEGGAIEPAEFATRLVGELDLTIDADQVLERFAGFPRGLYPGAVELVEDVRRARPERPIVVGLLSNTNKLHWESQPGASIMQELTDRPYLSYQLGVLKPDRAIFDHVVADLDMAADRILFIDDNQINVDGARAAGLQAELAKGPDEARSALTAVGVLG
jgi:putative hydrolase of the HAD superfamily